jgi:hypothetical protein
MKNRQEKPRKAREKPRKARRNPQNYYYFVFEKSRGERGGRGYDMKPEK